ncbi:phage major tail tube protein [Ignatzschineria rhizosphaerae]|uniref:Phage major tail tube protein n=1 Tax=Ignatzschineria rhizosphaerae TaxID=2923279 RepID=A0ABY3X4V2_9GAMM|nr:phage major tail tube protein [Ignatzschineria rhizosphaerae]UNM96067.1 phage major tail tube protein [Ignatzschineria rhizosphaerae]
MRLPGVLKNFELFLNADPIGRTVEEVTLPSTAKEYVEIKTGGMTRPLKIPVGFEGSMEVKFTTKGIDIQTLIPQGCGLGNIRLQFKGAIEDPATCDLIPFTANFTGSLENDPESLKKGDLSGGEVTLNAITAEYIWNNEVIYVERVLDNVLIVNGVDLKAEENAALGY